MKIKTIKYNPFNLNSIKEKLPKSTYDEESFQEKLKNRDKSKDSLDNLSRHQNRERVLSACGMRNERGGMYPFM